MSDPLRPGRARWTAAVIIAALVAVIAAVAVAGIVAATADPTASSPVVAPATAAPTTGAVTASATASPAVTATPTPSVKASKTATPTAQPTATATITAPKAIVKQLSVKVSRMEAVTGEASGPGEVAGPSVRFTIVITNTTGKSVVLSYTAVSAYYGSTSAPAIELSSPGADDFPASVATGSTATGVYVFNIPKASRRDVKVTVDTSVSNPVVAFQGSAPK